MRAPIKATVLLFSAIFVLGTFGMASGQAVFVNMGEVTGLTGPGGTIPSGAATELVIPVRFTNAGAARTAISNGYDFLSSDGVTYDVLSAVWSPAVPWDWPHAIAISQFPPFFDQGLFTNYFENGVGFAGLTGAAGSGLPADFDDIAYFITLTNVQGPDNATLTMDTTWWPPANYWLWSGVAENVAWDGPHNFVVEGAEELAPNFTSTPVEDGVVGDAYAYTVTADGIPAPEFELTVAPTGMGINAITGVIAWTPTIDDVFPVQVRAFNGVAPDAFQDFVVTVTPALEPPSFTSIPSTDGEVGTLYTYTIVVDGYPVPTLALTAAPAGMTLVGNEITWTPTAFGDFPVTVEATNSSATVPQGWTIAVVPAPEVPAIYSTPVTGALVGVLYTYNVDATGYPAPEYELTVAPDGMVIDEISGVIEWTPNAAGDFDVTVEATNASGTDDQSYVISISDEPYTDCWPQPSILKALENDRVLEFRIYNEDYANVDLPNIRVGNIPPYTEARVVDGVIITDAFIMRFLGSSGFRPIPAEGISKTYTVYYSYFDGTEKQLVGDFNLTVTVGDVTLDGQCNLDDVVFMAEYFFNGGEETQLGGENLYELMDIDANGQVDIRDALEIIQTAGL